MFGQLRARRYHVKISSNKWCHQVHINPFLSLVSMYVQILLGAILKLLELNYTHMAGLSVYLCCIHKKIILVTTFITTGTDCLLASLSSIAPLTKLLKHLLCLWRLLINAKLNAGKWKIQENHSSTSLFTSQEEIFLLLSYYKVSPYYNVIHQFTTLS